MSPTENSTRWLTLAFALPAQPAYGRVKIWRRLQKVGAVPFKNALYWLPGTDAALEDFEWILREIRELGGEGLILESRAVEGLTDGDIRALFERLADAAMTEADLNAFPVESRTAIRDAECDGARLRVVADVIASMTEDEATARHSAITRAANA